MSFLFFLIFTANTICFGAQCISLDIKNEFSSATESAHADSVFLCVVKKIKNQNQQSTITGYKVDPFISNNNHQADCLYCNLSKTFQTNFNLLPVVLENLSIAEYQFINPEIPSFFQIQFNANSERGSPKIKS